MNTRLNPLDHPIMFTMVRRLTPISAWHEHIPFAMFLVDILQPRVIVELGTQHGDSYCAFCQAGKELELDTRCYAIDTWQGDPQAGFYGPEVLTDLRAYHDPLYGSFSRLIQSTFDEALAHFADGTIDLLHIDGCHTYDAVKHDFESWLSKLSPRGVVLLHDTNVPEGDFGVKKFWEEIETRHPHFEFLHGHGLGILAVGGEQPPAFQAILNASEKDVIEIRNFFFQLGKKLALQVQQHSLRQQLTEKEQAVQTLQAHQVQLQRKQDQLQQQLTKKEQAAQTLQGQQVQLQQKQNQLRQQLTDKEQAVQTLQTRITELETQLTVLETGLAFLLLSKYRSALNHLLPNGTRRRRLYTLLAKVGGVLLDEGCQGFWSRMRHRLSCRLSKLPTELPHQKRPENQEVLQTVHSVWMPEIQLDRPPSLPDCRLAVITVVVVGMGAENTYRCLAALASHHSRYDFEVIVVADGVDERTAELLTSTTGIQIVENATRLGFAVCCNRAAAMARGRYLLLLRDNVVLQPGCLNELVETDVAQENCGMVGPKLVTPNHTLWEAGGLLGSNGSISRLGAGEDPASLPYGYLRIVDFCTSAILVRKSLFEQVGGFDKKFEACAEVDLALALQERGQRVYYQPLARAVLVPKTSHAGNERGSFIHKWGKRLTEQGPTESVMGPRCRVLFIDTYTPAPDKDGGSVDAFNQMRTLTAIGCQVTFAPSGDFTFTEKYTPALQRIGIRCVYPPYVSSLDEYIVQHGEAYNVVFLSRVNNAAYYIDKVRKHCPLAKVVFNTVDLHYLREMRRAEIEDSEELMRHARELRRIELNAMRKADCTMLISSKEKELIQSECPEANVFQYRLITDIRNREEVPFAERKDIFFIGSYKHLPNVDAVHYFVEDVWPLIRSHIPGIRFYIIGSAPPKEILHLASDDVVVTGYMKDITSFFNRCRLSVAPLRYGAGVKEKVIRSLGYALPVVATSTATEGTGLVDGENVLVRDDAEGFSDAVVRVYQNEELWRDLSEHGLAFFKKNYSPEAGRHTLSRLIREVTQDHRMDGGKKP